MSKYYATIGLEMHCEGSKVNSKVFSPAKNEYSDIPNENVVAIDRKSTSLNSNHKLIS